MKKIFILLVGKIICLLLKCKNEYKLMKYQKITKSKFKFVEQGGGGLDIGNPENLQIDQTSHFKSNTFIDASGGVRIGRYFHTGRTLTIWTSNHKYNNENFIPYDDESILKPVIIEDFVWLGSNVTILPGVTIGEGAIIGAGSVVSKDIPKYAVAVGNPCSVVKYRDIDKFKTLKYDKKFF